jgi:hypothetical protein
LLGAAGPTEVPPGGLAAAGAPEIDKVRAAFPELEILALIGHGGMGVVYRARQPRLDRLVALKILPPALATQPGFAERFTREARALGRLSHPNIVAVYDFGERAGIFYLMMEFVNGVNLRQAMRAGVKPEQALSLVPRICEALQFAHDHGVLHRDIKPENILLDTTGTPKLADFGIAKLAGEAGAVSGLTQTGAALGTAAYMAPEQIEHPGAVDHRADIYSLGVVLYEMLTGELPLGRFAVPSEKAKVAHGVDEVVMRALEKERERRQQSATEMKTEVEGVRTGALPPGLAARTAAGAAGRGAGPGGPFSGGGGPGGAGGPWAGWHPGHAPHHRLHPISRIFLALTILSAVCIPLAGASPKVRSVVEPSTLALLCPVFGGLIAISQILFGRRGPAQPRRPMGFWRGFMLLLLSLAVLFMLGTCVPYLAFRERSHGRWAAVEKPATVVVRTTDPDFFGKLGPGLIELVGVAPHPSKGKGWRKMNGVARSGSAWVIPEDRVAARPGQRAYDFVFRRDGFPKDATFTGYHLTPPSQFSAGALVEDAAKPGQPLSNYDSVQAILPDYWNTVTVRAGVAYGPWKTLSTSGAKNSIVDSAGYGGLDWKLYHGAMRETAAGELAVDFSYETPENWEVRVVGVTDSGVEVTKLRLSQVEQQTAWTFPKPKNDAITLLRFQVRPIEWVEFQNVVLPPADTAAGSPSPAPEALKPPDSTAAISKPVPAAPAADTVPKSEAPLKTEAASQSMEALYDEAIRIARANLDDTRQRVKAGTMTPDEVTAAERDLAIAEARGDVVRIAKARLAYLTERQRILERQHELGFAGAGEVHAAKNDRIQQEIELHKVETAAAEKSSVEGGAVAAKKDLQAVVAGEQSAAQPADDGLQRLYDEAIRLARANLQDLQERFKAGVGGIGELAAAKRDMAIAEARGDAVRIAEARLAFATENLNQLQVRSKAGIASAEELRNAEMEKNRAEAELLKAREANKR